MSRMIDALDFKPDSFEVAPKEEWRVMSVGHAKKSGVQPRFCAPNCAYYIRDKDGKCGRFFECSYFVFDMHTIKRGEMLIQVLFGTETKEPYDGVSWWVSEKQLIEVMGRRPSGGIDSDLGKRVVSAMISEYNALTSSSTEGIVIR